MKMEYDTLAELDLDKFEALVQAQQPATQPWTPVTDYSFQARQDIEGKHPQLIKATFQPGKVLDVGCGPGHLMALLEVLGIPCKGLDITADPKWTVGSRIWQYDIARDGEGPEWFVDMERDYLRADLVICREVLEHLTILGVRRAVRNLCRLSSRYVYVTTRFHPNPQSLLDVATSDDLDPTHITLLNQDFLRVLFILEGFTRRADLEEQMDWQHLHRVLVYERA